MGPLFKKKKKLLRRWNFLSLLNWIGALVLSPFQNLHPSKLEPLFVLWSFFLLKFLFISVNLPYSLTWNTVIMCGLAVPTTTWICRINYRHGYATLLFLHFLPLSNPWLCRIVASLSFFYRVYLGRFHQNIFPICFTSFSSPLSCNSIPCGCSALPGRNSNKKKNFMAPFYGWSSTASRLELLTFFPLSSQKFLVLVLSTLGGWKAESTLELPSGFWTQDPSIKNPVPKYPWG